MPDTPSPLDSVERSVKVIKESALLRFITYTAWYLVPFIPKWATKLDGAQISEVNLAGITFKLAQTEKKLEQALESSSPERSKTDNSVTAEKKLVTEALESVQTLKAQTSQLQPKVEPMPNSTASELPAIGNNQKSSPFWVYLGVATKDSLPPRNFKISKLPLAGQQIEAMTDVYKRNSSPIYKEGDGWYLGSTIGVIKAGQRVVVRRLERIESTQPESEVVWAQAEPAF